jgi:hypothetical protein
MDRSLVQTMQSQPGSAPHARVLSACGADGCVRQWREGNMSPHAGYVGQPLHRQGIQPSGVAYAADPVAGPIGLARPRDIAARRGTPRSRSRGTLRPAPFDAPRDLQHNSKRSPLW